MKEIIIRMKDMYEVYGDDFDPEEIEPTHTGLEIEYEGVVYNHLKHLTVDISAPKILQNWGEPREDWDCNITTSKHITSP